MFESYEFHVVEIRMAKIKDRNLLEVDAVISISAYQR